MEISTVSVSAGIVDICGAIGGIVALFRIKDMDSDDRKDYLGIVLVYIVGFVLLSVNLNTAITFICIDSAILLLRSIFHTFHYEPSGGRKRRRKQGRKN